MARVQPAEREELRRRQASRFLMHVDHIEVPRTQNAADDAWGVDEQIRMTPPRARHHDEVVTVGIERDVGAALVPSAWADERLVDAQLSHRPVAFAPRRDDRGVVDAQHADRYHRAASIGTAPGELASSVSSSDCSGGHSAAAIPTAIHTIEAIPAIQ